MAKEIKVKSKTNKQWREFEKLVSRIEKFLCPEGATVTSPDYVPDPVTGTMRELDASIRYSIGSAEVLVAIECRNRSTKQDVMWVEHLIAKKLELGLSIVIGVSSSDFTVEAKKKAKLRGIQLRKMNKITDEDILILPVMNLDYRGFKTKQLSFVYDDANRQKALDYLEGFIASNGEDALRDAKIIHFEIDGLNSVKSTFEIFQDYYNIAVKENKFSKINVPKNGDSEPITMHITFNKIQYLLNGSERIHIQGLIIEFILFDRKERLKASAKMEYTDSQNSEIIAEVHEYSNDNPISSYKNFTFKIDSKSKRRSLIGQNDYGQEIDFTSFTSEGAQTVS